MPRIRIGKAGPCILPVLLLGVILVGITPASAFTATLTSPAAIHPGDLISFSIGGLANNDVFRIVISSTNLVNTATSYSMENFTMPFGFQAGTSSLSATGSNVNALSMHVKTETDEVTYSKTGGPTLTVTSAQDIHKKVYNLIEFSGTPSGAGPVGVSLQAQGTVTGTPAPDDPADLNFILQGASSGDLHVQIFDGATPVLDTVITVTTPSTQVSSATNPVPPVPAGSTAPPISYPETNTTLTLTAANNIDAGTSITVTQYTSPPTGSTSPASSVYKTLGQYMTIESTDPAINSKIGYMVIRVKYNPSDIPPGVYEADLKVYYFNPGTNNWEALPGYPGVNDTLDSVNKYVIGNSTHLSTFGILVVIPSLPPSGGGGGAFAGGGGGGGGGGIGYTAVSETTAAAYQVPAANITPAEETPSPPAAEMVTPAEVIPERTMAQQAPETVTATATATKAPGIPLSPLAGVLGTVLAAGIFLSLRKH